VWPPPGMRPDGHAGDGLRRHPSRVASLCFGVELGAPKRHRNRWDEAPLQAFGERDQATRLILGKKQKQTRKHEDLVAIGYWLLAIGYWLLAVGSQLPAPSSQLLAPSS
jgi:hypothetical protein